MKLFILENAKETYIYNVQSIESSTDSLFGGGNYNEEDDFTEIINTLQFRLEKDFNEKRYSGLLYKATDFYSGPTILPFDQQKSLLFYTVSPKLKTQLEQLNLPKHKFYPITLNIDKKVDLPYYILQIDSSMTPYTDFSQSSFYGINTINNEVTYYDKGEYQSDEHLTNSMDEDIFLCDKSLFINQDLDWVYMAPYFIISEKSKQLFEENNIIGMEFIPFYELPSDFDEPNELGYLNYYGGREIIINGKSSMNGLNINDFPNVDN